MSPAAAHPLDDLTIGNVDVHHRVDGDAGFLHGVGLRDRARKSVEQETVLAVGFFDPFLDQADDHFVGNQPARIHVALGFFTELRARLDRGAQHVARRDLGDLESVFDVIGLSVFDVIGLGSFTRAGAAQENQTHEVSSFDRMGIARRQDAPAWPRQSGRLVRYSVLKSRARTSSFMRKEET